MRVDIRISADELEEIIKRRMRELSYTEIKIEFFDPSNDEIIKPYVRVDCEESY